MNRIAHLVKDAPPPLPAADPTVAGIQLNRELSENQRARLRQRVTQMGRPLPGTSAILVRPLSAEIIAIGSRDVTYHDLVGMAPFALRRYA